MDENTLRSRQKLTTKSSDPISDQEKEKMFLKNRKPVVENYDFGDLQRVPPNVREIMDKNFSRLFIWELYFGESSALFF
jgi:hypothetical protein